MKIGLYFGTFNPIHNGHISVAEFVLKNTDLKKIWFVVSPQNPLKKNMELLFDKARLHLVQLAIEGKPDFKACDTEFNLPLPSYTINTLDELKKKFPQNEFSLIMGSDNLEKFERWKDYEKILSSYEILVYPRTEKIKTQLTKNAHVKILSSPLMEISSTDIRKMIEEKKSAKNFLPEKVEKEILLSRFYLK
ncbi:MAG TPA: nicotinic acid mononucleotide adenylyltransferase [Bacteroidetes bacterium]|nr:nicotinic acid mononucleotide adenylyltransferase [Bacteroidota bacterium]